MQWGDMSFKDEPISSFLQTSNGARNIPVASNIRLNYPLNRIGLDKLDSARQSVMSSRTNKLQSLAANYAIDHSPKTLQAMQQEMQSMRNYDRIFADFSRQMGVSGIYDPYSINYDCLRAGVETFEKRCGLFSDYGLGKIKYIAQACEIRPLDEVVEAFTC